MAHLSTRPLRSEAFLLAIGCALLGQPAHAQAPPAPVAQAAPAGSATPAVEGVLAAFQTHPLVGLGDAHGLAQELDFYAALVRHPRFAPEVGNVVVEFGGAAHQAIIDRYIAGEAVPYLELRKVWTDTVGWVPMPSAIGFMNFFAQVRATNRALAPEQRIRVWLGEPPIDWSKISTREDLAPYQRLRESHPAEVIRREILARGKKSLVIYGGAHFLRERDLLRPAAAAKPGTEAALKSLLVGSAAGTPPYDAMAPSFAQLVRTQVAGMKSSMANFGALNSMEFKGVDITGGDVYDVAFANERVRAGVSLDADGRIQGATFRPLGSGARAMLVDEVEAHHPKAFFIAAPYTGYADQACSERFEAKIAGGPTPALLQATALLQELRTGGCGGEGPISIADAVLFVGPRAQLTRSPVLPDLYLDEDYRRELSRRQQIMTGTPLNAPWIENTPATPLKFRP